MGADRAAHRHGHHGSDPGVRAIRACSNFRWAARTRLPARSIPPRRSRCRSIRRCSRSTEIPAERRSRCSAARSMSVEVAPAIANDGNGCANRQSVSHSSDDHEQVQTARIDYNINAEQHRLVPLSGGHRLQAAYTDPINPLFDALSPQPLYSFAAGYTHVFSQNLVNYFNPAFSWYESLFGPSDFQKTLAAFPIVLQGSGANAPFHHGRRPRQHLGAGPPRLPLFHQRQSRLEPRRARTALRHQYPHLPAERLRLRRRIGPDRHLHHPAAVHLRRRVHGHQNFPHFTQRAFQLPESRPLRAGHLESDQQADLDVRYSRHVQFQSAESA